MWICCQRNELLVGLRGYLVTSSRIIVLFNVVDSDLEEDTKSPLITLVAKTGKRPWSSESMLSWHEMWEFAICFNLMLINLYLPITTTATQVCVVSGKLFILNVNKC